MLATISWLELVWTLCGVIPFVVNLHALWLARADQAYLDARGENGIKRIIVLGRIRNIALRIGKAALIIFVGVAAMTQPPANAAQPITPTGIVVTTGLVLIAALLTVASIFDAIDQQQIDRYQIRQEREQHRRRDDSPRGGA